MAEAIIETIKNGPYIVKGEFELRDAEGNVYPGEKRMALCRWARPRPNRSATALIPRSVSRPPRKRSRNPPRIKFNWRPNQPPFRGNASGHRK